jgi:hypothetical protein
LPAHILPLLCDFLQNKKCDKTSPLIIAYFYAISDEISGIVEGLFAQKTRGDKNGAQTHDF